MGFLKLFSWLSVVIYNGQSISIETVLKEYRGAGFVVKNGAMSLLYVAKDKKVQKCIIILF
jgi:hypothetical protein